jgi:hypothetical protein
MVAIIKGAIKWLELDSLDNQNITAALLVGTYTSDGDRLVFATIYAQGLAGGGDYVYYVTLTPLGLSEAEMLKTTQTLGATTYVLAAQTIGIAVRNGDVLKVYLKGLAGDTTTPDIRVNFYVDHALQPTLDDTTLDIAVSGEVGIDLSNIKQATAPTTLTNITVPLVTSVGSVSGSVDSVTDPVSVGSIAANAVDANALATDAVTEIVNALLAVGAGGLFPAGAIVFTYTVTALGIPVEAVDIWISTDLLATNIIWRGMTDQFGVALDVLNNKPSLDPGTYYIWAQKYGFTPNSFPDIEIVS